MLVNCSSQENARFQCFLDRSGNIRGKWSMKMGGHFGCVIAEPGC